MRLHPAAYSAAAGVVAGIVFTLSPLLPWVAALGAAVIALAGRGLPAPERRWIRVLLGAAFALRIVAVAAVFLISAHDDQSAPVLFGDEAYAQARAMRVRSIALGLPAHKTDYVLAFEEYGRNSYTDLLSGIYVLAGPSPYASRLLNTVVFLAGAALLFRVARAAYGPAAALVGAAIVLFLPTLFMWSIALLKEPLYFAVMAAAVTCMVIVLRRGPLVRRAAAVAGGMAAALMAGSLRSGAGSLVAASAGLSAALLISTRSAARVAVLAVLMAVAATVFLQAPAVQQRVTAAAQRAAAVHAGHVFTVGHAYKLLDETAYIRPLRPDDVRLSEAEAARFVLRGIASFIAVPLPWQIATTGELVLLPEILFWYAIVLFALAGAVEAFRRDAVVTSVLAAQALTAAAAVAFTNGNVGTLLRFRGLVTPYLVWIAAVGFCSVLRRQA